MAKTIRDVAKHAGVSIATVSRVLSGSRKVSPDAMQRVQAAIRELDFVPNALAQNLSNRETRTVLLVVPFTSSQFFVQILRGAQARATLDDYAVLIGDGEGNVESTARYFDQVRSKRADGIITLFDSLPSPPAGHRHWPLAQLPPLVMGAAAYASPKLPSVQGNKREAAEQLTTHLAELGHKRIAHITGLTRVNSSRAYFAGYQAALRKSRLKQDDRLVVEGQFTTASGVHAMEHLLKQPELPTAVFCANDDMAIGAMQAIKNAGLKVPDDISVAGFDDIEFAALCDPALTTVHVPRFEIGYRCMDLLIAQLRGGRAVTEIVLEMSLVRRSSTAPPHARHR